jgi:Acetoacetate decarboxylase (ADC)
MPGSQLRYPGLHGGDWSPSAPQLLKDVWTLAITYHAEPDAIREALPPGLEPHPEGRIEMTMYAIPDAGQTSGFGAFSLTYITLEVAGHDGYAQEGTVAIPGRAWVAYWCDSHRVRSYAREAVGIPAQPGSCEWHRTERGKTASVLTVDGKPVIRLVAATSERPAGKMGGLLNYFTHRQIPNLNGSGFAIDKLVYVPIPFVVESYEARPISLEFSFPEGHRANRFRPIRPIEQASLLYGTVSFTYSQARSMVNYLDGAK